MFLFSVCLNVQYCWGMWWTPKVRLLFPLLSLCVCVHGCEWGCISWQMLISPCSNCPEACTFDTKGLLLHISGETEEQLTFFVTALGFKLCQIKSPIFFGTLSRSPVDSCSIPNPVVTWLTGLTEDITWVYSSHHSLGSGDQLSALRPFAESTWIQLWPSLDVIWSNMGSGAWLLALARLGANTQG